MFSTSGMVLASFVGVYAGQELITETSKSIFNRAWDIITDTHPDIKEITDPMDLVAKVQVVESIVREITDEIEIESLVPSKPLQISLKQMQDILDSIHQDISDIKEGIEYHKSLWFHRFRVPAYYEIIKKLKLDKSAMDSRLDNLVRVIALFRQAQEHNPQKLYRITSNDHHHYNSETEKSSENSDGFDHLEIESSVD